MKRDQLIQLLNALYSSAALTEAGVEQPEQFRHQPAVIAAAWERLVERKQAGVVLADEVGLGKTYEALATMFFYLLHILDREKRNDFRVLIVLPPKLLTKWRDELERFANWAHAIPDVLSAKEKPVAEAILLALGDSRELMSNTGRNSLWAGGKKFEKKDHGIYLLNINKLKEYTGIGHKANRVLQKEFEGIPWEMIIMDEAHHYARSGSDRGSQRGRAAQALSNRGRNSNTKVLLCTATPFQLDTSELVNLLGMLEPNARKLGDIERAIEAYNQSIVELKQRVEDGSCGDPLEAARLKAMEAKECLETLLRSYIIRSMRPEKEGVEARRYLENPISPGKDFPWLYWRVREWARQLAHVPDSHLRTFLPTTLQTALSSSMALEDHLKNFGKKHGRIKSDYNLTRLQLLARLHSRDTPHPKFDEIEKFIRNRIDKAAHDFSGSMEDLADYKCVIFANRKRTIQALSRVHDNHDAVDFSSILSDRIRSRRNDQLHTLGIPSEEFDREVLHVIKRYITRLIEEYPIIAESRPNIWDTPYYSEVDNEYMHLSLLEWRGGDNLSMKTAAELKKKSVRQMLEDNLRQKIREPLNQFEFVCKLSYSPGKNLVSWKSDLDQLIFKAADRRIRNPLTFIWKYYQSDDRSSDIVRERLRLRLSRLAYSLSPREIIEDLSGEVDFPTRQQIIDSFNYDLYPLILICSAVGEEGIDLQRRCNTVIHYDLEWNPAKVEQREGRVDRLGRLSSSQVEITTYKLSETYDERILARCQARKVWMELYLCKAWKEEGKKLEEELIQTNPETTRKIDNLEWLSEYRLNLKPN